MVNTSYLCVPLFDMESGDRGEMAERLTVVQQARRRTRVLLLRAHYTRMVCTLITWPTSPSPHLTQDALIQSTGHHYSFSAAGLSKLCMLGCCWGVGRDDSLRRYESSTDSWRQTGTWLLWEHYTLYINNIGVNIPNAAFHSYADNTVIYCFAPTPNACICRMRSIECKNNYNLF